MRSLSLFVLSLLFSFAALAARAQTPDVAAFETAVAYEKLDTVTQMLAADPTLIQAAAKANKPVLYDAIHSRRDTTDDNRKALVALLLAKGADPNRSGQNLTYTPLIVAEQDGAKDIVTLLLDKGADPNLTDLQGVSPLAHALADNHTDMALLLIGKGLKLDMRDRAGFTPLLVAARAATPDPAVIQALLDKGTNVNTRAGASTDPYRRDGWPLGQLDQRGLTPLHLAAASGNVAVMTLLLAKGADPKAKTDDGNTPLHEAARALSAGVAALLAAGADPKARNRVGDLPIHLALRSEASGPDAAAALAALIAKSDLTAPDQFGLTPPLLALVHHNAAAEAAIRTQAGKFSPTVAVFDAAARDDVPTLTSLLTRQPYLVMMRLPNGWTPLHAAALWGAAETARLLIAKGADVNAAGLGIGSPLETLLTHIGETGATSAATRDFAALLIRAGANVNRSESNIATPLISAIGTGDSALVAMLIAHKANVNAPNERGEFPLLYAVNGRPSLVSQLLAAGADVNAQDSVQMTALTRALNNGNAEVVRLLVAGGADVNLADTIGYTPLMRAVMSGSADLTALLLSKGAAVTPRNSRGETALAIAEKRSPTLVDLLRQHGAVDAPPLPPARNYNDIVTVFNMADRGDTDGVKAALDKDPAWIGVTDDRGDTLLHAAFSNNYAVGNHLLDVVTLLVARGADVNARNKDGQTPLYTAAPCGNPEIKQAAALLIQKGAKINARDRRGQTPLHRAAMPEFVALLVAAGADVNARDLAGNTPLHLAASYMRDMVPALLAAGANPNALNNAGETPLQLAFQNPAYALPLGLTEKSNLLLKDRFGMAPIMRMLGKDLPQTLAARHLTLDDSLLAFHAAEVNDVPALTRLLAAKPYLAFARLPNGQTALHLAALGLAADTARLLLDKGADPNARDASAVTPLLAVVGPARKDPRALGFATLLLDHGADVNAVSRQGNMPIHQAFWADNPDLFTLLLARHADVNGRDEAGNTPLHLAVNASNPSVPLQAEAATFLAAGADINAWGGRGEYPNGDDPNGLTPLETAISDNNPEMMRFLVEKGAAVNAPGATGITPLAMAALRHKPDIAPYLTAHGAH